MTEKARKAWSSYWWGALGTVGLALVAAAVLLVVSSAPGAPMPVAECADCETPGNPTCTPTETATPTVTPTPNDGCILDVRKSDDPDPVAEGGQITYTITVDNDGDSDCDDIVVTDGIPDGTDCVEISVEDDGGLDIDFDEDDCDSSGDVEWSTDDELGEDDEFVLTMVVELEDDVDEGDEIENEVCVEGYDIEMEAYEPGDCDTEKTDVEEAEPTSTPTSTPYVIPTIAPTVAPPVIAPAPVPVAQPAAELIAPPTGSGSASGGGMADTIALALGLTGGALLLVSGAGLWVRRTR